MILRSSADAQPGRSRDTTQRPSVSIVIPAFNRARFLGETLESVRVQSLRDWECIIVDDGSTDDTPALAAEYANRDPRFRVIRIKNGGPSAARNHGYLRTSPDSKFVTFMDSDDVWLPHALEALRQQLRAEPTLVGTHGLAEMINEAGEPHALGSYSAHGRRRLGVERKRLVVWPLDRPTEFAVLVNGNVLFPPGLVLARREAYESAGMFDECFRGPEDWDMLIRLSRQGNLGFVNEVILHYRMHDSNLGAAAGIEAQAWLVRCKAFHSPENDATQQRIAREGWRAYQRYMVAERYRVGHNLILEGRLARAAAELARIPVHLFRFGRGYPTPKVIRVSKPWNRANTASC